ncbi:MAG: hypothetical protein Q9219_001099 [cf. Caloplaca sp. 3 TL-2023]
MLTESFVVSTRTVEKKANATTTKDLGVHVHDYQPNPSSKLSFKKSSTQSNCLAVNATHIFAAQADKSVIHVYSRERGGQEAVVPFPEKITCLALIGQYYGAGTLALGTQGGRLILWELATGRQISTPQSHLQSVTCLAVDPTFNFLLSGSSDSNINVWSIPMLLSFHQASQDGYSQPPPYMPMRTLTNHRAAINDVIFGHSASKANFALSAAKDQTCLVWDYINGTVLHTYVLSSNPLCLALDPADRAVYAGYEDGSIQRLDFYQKTSLTHPLYDQDQRSTPTQPPLFNRWNLPESSSSPAICVQTSYDGTVLISGHENGKVQTWNIAKGKYDSQLADFTLPVTNLRMLSPTGFPRAPTRNLKLHNIVKPRYEGSLDSANVTNSSSIIPRNYSFTAQFTSTLPFSNPSSQSDDLDNALTHVSFPDAMFEEGIAELASLNNPSVHRHSNEESESMRKENAHLTTQLDDALRRQREAIAKVIRLEEERLRRKEDDAVKKARKRRRRIRMMKAEQRKRKIVMGEVEDGGGGAAAREGSETGDEILSSDTDELSSD